MAEAITIARPYAKAVYDLAHESKSLKDWSDSLQFAAAVVSDAQMAALISNPKVAPEKTVELLLSVCQGKLTAGATNLVKVLADNDRLELLPEISVLFEELKAQAERTVHAVLTAAVAVDKAQQDKFIAALKKRLGCEVSLECKLDPSVVGGAIIRAGDLVIDGSVSGQLDRLASVMSR
ncbi:MAG: F0F1 ATP synthase subunit delta [Gammaproteobacteria bacterium]|nr:F0F1 ATP synthase subunit delta [Gammaproteobacteria bacterium]